jgi:hypothetical protein
VSFSLKADSPHPVYRQSSPAGWIFINASTVTPMRYGWHSFERETDIAPGQSTGPFQFEAPLLPGLTKAYVQGFLSEEAAVNLHSAPLSPWLAAKLEEALMYENATVHAVVIGPKFELSAMSKRLLAQTIAEELLDASRRAEFQQYRAFL